MQPSALAKQQSRARGFEAATRGLTKPAEGRVPADVRTGVKRGTEGRSKFSLAVLFFSHQFIAGVNCISRSV